MVITLDRKPNRLPCLVLDSSKEGFRLRGSFDLRRGQVVELILDEETPSPERCSVVWIGKAGPSRKGKSAWNRAIHTCPATRLTRS